MNTIKKISSALLAVILSIVLIPGVTGGKTVLAAENKNTIHFSISFYHLNGNCYLFGGGTGKYYASSYGDVEANAASFAPGEEVTLTVRPYNGYVIDHVRWTDGPSNGLNKYHDITSTLTFTAGKKQPHVYVYLRAVENATHTPYENTMKVSGKTAAVKYKKLRKKAQTVAASKVVNVSYPQGDVTYKLTGVKRGSSNKYKKYFKIDPKSGKVAIKKKLKKGTYKVTCSVTAAGNGDFKKATKTVTFKIKVK